MYTRKGDEGRTDTASGRRVTKASLIMEWEGSVDELISQIGVAKLSVHWDDIKDDLDIVQMDLFHLSEEILTSGKGRKLRRDGVSWMEDRIAVYMKETGKVKLFVVPGGSKEATILHLARAITRRAERRVVELNKSEIIDPLLYQYVNRLSSLLFAMAVVANKRKGVEEVLFPWPNPDSIKK